MASDAGKMGCLFLDYWIRVKQYSPGKPQLKIEISHSSTAEHIFCRGNPDSYEGISEYVGVFPRLPEDQQNVPMQQR